MEPDDRPIWSTSYFSTTSSLKYSYIIALPLLILYEILILISQPDPEVAVRITADIWFKTLFALFGFDTLKMTFAIAIILGAVIFIRERNKPVTYKGRYFGMMIAESAVYAIVLAIIISGLVGFIFQMSANDPIAGLSTLQKLALSLGAGLYEELVFRVILVFALLYLFKWLKFASGWRQAAAMITAALIFSAVHYVGPMGDAFTLSSFTFRFLFGLALNGVLIYRGFGIAAWTHAIYDVIVLLLI